MNPAVYAISILVSIFAFISIIALYVKHLTIQRKETLPDPMTEEDYILCDRSDHKSSIKIMFHIFNRLYTKWTMS